MSAWSEWHRRRCAQWGRAWLPAGEVAPEREVSWGCVGGSRCRENGGRTVARRGVRWGRRDEGICVGAAAGRRGRKMFGKRETRASEGYRRRRDRIWQAGLGSIVAGDGETYLPGVRAMAGMTICARAAPAPPSIFSLSRPPRRNFRDDKRRRPGLLARSSSPRSPPSPLSPSPFPST